MEMEWNEELYIKALQKDAYEEGEIQAKQEAAQRMKIEKIAVDIISRVTDLSENEIAML